MLKLSLNNILFNPFGVVASFVSFSVGSSASWRIFKLNPFQGFRFRKSEGLEYE